MRPWKHILFLLLAGALPVLLSGCMMTASVEDLYTLPQLPDEYRELSAQMDAILASGAEYAAPTAGSNLQPVQLEDLDGDGMEEAVAFFRQNSDERPLKIYIFRAVEDTYVQASVIEGSGTAIHSIRYEDMDHDGVKEVLVSWRVSTEVQAMAAYALEDLEPVMIMSAAYTRYEVIDLDSDDVMELVVLRSDETESGGTVADYYDWDGGSLQLRSGARLSTTPAELQWVQTGTLESGETALFVTGRVTGVEETSRAVTDILTYREPDLTNIVLSSSTGVSTQISRFLNLQPTDVNGDGITEVPRPAELLSTAGEDTYWKIYWFSYAADGTPTQQAITYHNQSDSWYLLIPEAWDTHFTVRQDSSSATERATTFYSVNNGGVGEALFTVYTLTGSDREARAAKAGRSILRLQPDTIYAVDFTEAYSQWRFAVDQEDLAGQFRPILAQWNTTDN